MAIATKSNFFFDGERQKNWKFASFLRKLLEFSHKLQLIDLSRSIEQILKHIDLGTFTVAVGGEVGSQKITLINAWLGANAIAPQVDSTEIILRITHSVEPTVKILFRDDREQTILLEQISEYVNNFNNNIAQIDVGYPFRYGFDDIEFLSLPETNGNRTFEDLCHADLLILVLQAESLLAPNKETSLLEHYLTKNKANYLLEHYITKNTGKILFVITNDRMENSDSANISIEQLKTRLQQQIIANFAHRYKRDAWEYLILLAKIGQLTIFCLSTTEGLQAKLKGDRELLVTSRFGGFEKTLDRLLKQEKGLIFLTALINQTLTAATEIIHAIVRREKTLAAQQEQLQQTYEQPLAELKANRKSRREKVDKLRHLQELDSIQREILDLRAKWEREKTTIEIERDRLKTMLEETETMIRESSLESKQIVNLIGTFCDRCGKMSRPKANFCTACGTQLNCC
ncbi:MAG: hypothetical protein ACRC2R_08600 [Xenococcaceae cyanobacterium]